MKHYYLIIIILFIVKILKGKKLSAYNTKWMFYYVLYLSWLHILFYYYEDWDDILDEYIIWALLVPLFTYLIFPFLWKYVGKWKFFKWLDSVTDKWYNTIKDL